MYRRQGGNLTEYSAYGIDPLRDRPDLVHRRDDYFFSTHSSFDDIFSDAVSSNGDFFQTAVMDFVHVTESLVPLV